MTTLTRAGSAVVDRSPTADGGNEATAPRSVLTVSAVVKRDGRGAARSVADRPRIRGGVPSRARLPVSRPVAGESSWRSCTRAIACRAACSDSTPTSSVPTSSTSLTAAWSGSAGRGYMAVAPPFPWLSETIDLGKVKNHFESRVTEYRSRTTLVWE